MKKNTLKLETIMEIDQQAIKDFRAGKIIISEHVEINKTNVEVVKKIISEIGFSTINLTSQKAYKAAVLVVLHSGDLEFLNQSVYSMESFEEYKKIVEKSLNKK